MIATRRHALAMAAASAALSPTLLLAEPIEMPDEEMDGPHTDLKTKEDRNDHMLAPVGINGQGPFQFLLDTGANASVVSHKLAQKLSLTAGPPALVHTVVGVRERPCVVLDSLTVGPRQRKKVRAASMPIRGSEVDGVLGVDWLKGQRLVMDFKANRLEITKSRQDENEAGKAVVVPARRRNGQLTIVDADLSGKHISAIIDSGAETTLCNGPLKKLVRDSERRRGLKTDEPRIVHMESLAGEPFQGETVFLPFLRLGGLHLGNVQVAWADAHVFDVWGLKDSPALVIGMDLLKQFNQVALDFGRSAVRFEFV